MRFGEFLIANGFLERSAIEEGLSTQRYKKLPLGRTLRDLGFLDQKNLNQYLSIYLVPDLILDATEIAEKVTQAKISEDIRSWCERKNIIPFSESHFLSTEFCDDVVEEAEKLWGCPILLSTVSEELFRYATTFLPKNGKQKDAKLTLSQRVTDDEKLEGENPYTRLYRECIETAKKESVSDIHIEPKPDSIQIRFRLHGVLFPWKVLAKEHRDALINKVKWLTNMDLSLSGRPQDSRVTYYGKNLNLRVNAIPTRHGDKIVIRLLDQDKEFDVHKVGLPEAVVSDLKKIANLPNGLLIISGPTGSGKTTTLYGLVNSLDHKQKNITTLEDPSEYELKGVTQTEVGKNLSFANALKAFLRQDPDVIFLGEIRDEETARLSFKIANTGHLVITTLHSNGALESIERLKAMGIDDLSIESTLRMSGAQRLIQELCPHCSKPYEGSELRESLRLLEEKFGKSKEYRVKCDEGCDKCIKGIKGRLPILEYALTEEISSYLRGNKRALQTSLMEAAFKLAKEGRVDIHEIPSIG